MKSFEYIPLIALVFTRGTPRRNATRPFRFRFCHPREAGLCKCHVAVHCDNELMSQYSLEIECA